MLCKAGYILHSLTQHNFQGEAVGSKQVCPLFASEAIALRKPLNDMLRTVSIVTIAIADVTRVGKVLGEAIFFFKNTFPHTLFAKTLQNLRNRIIGSLKELS